MDLGTWVARSIRTDSPGQCSHRGAQEHREQFDHGLIGLPFRHTFALETGQRVQKHSTRHSGSRSGLPPRLRFHSNASSITLQAAPISSSDPQSTPSSSRNPTALSFAFMADFTNRESPQPTRSSSRETPPICPLAEGVRPPKIGSEFIPGHAPQRICIIRPS